MRSGDGACTKTPPPRQCTAQGAKLRSAWCPLFAPVAENLVASALAKGTPSILRSNEPHPQSAPSPREREARRGETRVRVGVRARSTWPSDSVCMRVGAVTWPQLAPQEAYSLSVQTSARST
eukprot:5613918-Pleurochrysis_carterae.AAC.1